MVKLVADLADKLVGQRIQMRRKEKQMTAAELAEEVDISQQQLSRYERGTNKINIGHLIRIALCLGTPISWFFIDCLEDLKLDNTQSKYSSTIETELKVRFEQVWGKLSNDKRRSLIIFLDEFTRL